MHSQGPVNEFYPSVGFLSILVFVSWKYFFVIFVASFFSWLILCCLFQLNDVIGQLYDFISERQREASRSVTPHVQVCVLITLSALQIGYLYISIKETVGCRPIYCLLMKIFFENHIGLRLIAKIDIR